MKYFLLFFITLTATLKTPAQNLAARDSIQILAIINDWNQGWQSKDHNLAAKGYSNDARFTNAFGDKRRGQKEVLALLQEVFALPFVMAGNSETTEHALQAIDPTTIIVHTSVVRKGQQMPDGTVIPDRQTTHLRVFQNAGNKWEITAHLISDARDKQVSKH